MAWMTALWTRVVYCLGYPKRRQQARAAAHAQAILDRVAALLPEVITVDWTLAPDAATTWIYDERARRGRWLSGRNEVEEYGIVWEWWPAPDFGATRKNRVEKTAADEAHRLAVKSATALEQATAAASAPSLPARRL